MPDRLVNLVSPVAKLHAQKLAPALEALVGHACLQSAMSAALISRGMFPGTAQMTVDQWRSLGLLVPPSVYAPAHVAEATLMGTTVPITQQVLSQQPWLANVLAVTPGYERLMAQPGIAGIPGVGMLGKGVQQMLTQPWAPGVLGAPQIGVPFGPQILGAPQIGVPFGPQILTQPGVSQILTQPGISQVLTQPGLAQVVTQPGISQVLTQPAQALGLPGVPAVFGHQPGMGIY